MMKDQLQQEFIAIYGKPAANAFFSPGRVNLIGEHIDYNGGVVMPCAITFWTYVLAASNNEGTFRFRSLNFKDKLDISVPSDYQKTGEVWFNYPMGIIKYFLKQG